MPALADARSNYDPSGGSLQVTVRSKIKGPTSEEKNFKVTQFALVMKQTGYAVAQLVEALRYKSEGHGFDPRCCHWNFSFT